jgi:lysophospholipid hydrolase
MVGGTSIGSFIGGLYSRYEDIWYTYWRAKDFASRMTSVWRQLLDLTYPVTSWFTGHEFNRTIWKGFGQSEIEDTWLSYFCVTTNITHSRLEIHTAGYLWYELPLSASLTDIRRYVRASMSLSGFLPPLCDQGNMLLDGGYLNNLPGDVIRSLGADTVIAVDVGSEDDTSPATYGDSLSGWWAMLLRMKPWGKPAVIPSLAEIQSRLAYVSCVKQLEEVKNMDGCYYLHPPVSQFATLDFGRFEEIYEVGYKYGQEVVKEWEIKGLLNQWRPTTKKPRKHGRRNSV